MTQAQAEASANAIQASKARAAEEVKTEKPAEVDLFASTKAHTIDQMAAAAAASDFPSIGGGSSNFPSIGGGG